MTTLGGSLFLMAVGAILASAVTVHAKGFDSNKIGVILMIVGGIGPAGLVRTGAAGRVQTAFDDRRSKTTCADRV